MNRIIQYISSPKSIAPLVVFRVIFGAMMFIATLRFYLLGWIEKQYIEPDFFFKYYGFEWVRTPDSPELIYGVFILLALSSLFIMAGFRYRLSAIVFFITFSFIELWDKSNYLNHYYFISLVSFLMIFLPANRAFSLDVLFNPSLFIRYVPRWTFGVIRFQLGLVYFFAGIAKLNYDWLFRAMPLRIWLPAKANIPVIGPLLDLEITAYLMSWGGAVYDLTIAFLLLYRPTRVIAYLSVLFFHLLTGALFQIGMFPYIMILSSLIFLPSGTFDFLISRNRNHETKKFQLSPRFLLPSLLAGFFLFQIIFPFRYLLYPGNLFWNEEGYRFSWRVMLMEKAGSVTFHAYDPETGLKKEITPSCYLTKNQEKMMATQPDMILEFSHHLEKELRKEGFKNPEIKAESYVTMNGSGSRLFIDPQTDLTLLKDGFSHKSWVLPYDKSPFLLPSALRILPDKK